MSGLWRAIFRRPVCPRVEQTLHAMRSVRKIAEDMSDGRAISTARFQAIAAKLNR